MNVTESYQRNLERTLPEQDHAGAEPAIQASRDHEAAVKALAVHRDPSLQRPGARPSLEGFSRPQPSVAWVRPSELASVVGAPWVRRGIDLQTELTKRARRTPKSAATRAGRHLSNPANSATGRGLISGNDTIEGFGR